jgi:hypothetical protein
MHLLLKSGILPTREFKSWDAVQNKTWPVLKTFVHGTYARKLIASNICNTTGQQGYVPNQNMYHVFEEGDDTSNANKVLYGQYDRNQYPLVPLGCKAVVYEDGDTRGSRALRGVDDWYLGPSMDHYRCDLYYIPETRGYQILGSTELFLQHCQLPDMTPHQHFHALTDKLMADTDHTSTTPKGQRIIQLLQDCIMALLAPPPTAKEQRVNNNTIREAEQRVINDSLIITIPWITDAPGIIEARDPTAKRKLKETPCVHHRVTRNNTLAIVASPIASAPYVPIPSGAQQCIVMPHTINLHSSNEQDVCNLTFTLTSLLQLVVERDPPHFEHFACPMVHPVTGKTISSYKKLMHDPATAKTWQTAFGKDFWWHGTR